MNQTERRRFLIEALLQENPQYGQLTIPPQEEEQKKLLRSLFNLRPPQAADERFLQVQDAYLQEENRRRGIITLAELSPIAPHTYLWRGDITTLQCDAIVNAANSGMTGCYQPCHNCIDNCIHTYAGVQLRNTCNGLMEQQGHAEPTGQAKITPAYNLPSRFVLHTVGPIVQGRLTEEHCRLLASCYRACLELAAQNHVQSIAFCCISTGVFMFPNEKAAEIAVETVRAYREETGSQMDVIFNVFQEFDEVVYRSLLAPQI